MKRFLSLACLVFVKMQAMEYTVQFENDQVCVAKALVEAKEEVGSHRDELPRIVIGLKGGTITRLESDGREVDVCFPEHQAIYLTADPENEVHRAVNKSIEPVEVIIVQLKKPMEINKETKVQQETLQDFSPLAKSFQPGSIYEHYKKIRYKILGIARHSETLEELVVYQALYGEGDIWVRPISMFLEDVTIDGELKPRFKKVEI